MRFKILYNKGLAYISYLLRSERSCANGKSIYNFPSDKKFEIVELKLTPTKLGKLIYPAWLRNKLSCVVNGLIAAVNVKLIVLKEK